MPTQPTASPSDGDPLASRKTYADLAKDIDNEFASCLEKGESFLPRAAGERLWKEVVGYARARDGEEYRKDDKFQAVREQLFLRMFAFRTQPASTKRPSASVPRAAADSSDTAAPRMFLQGPPGLEQKDQGDRKLNRFLEICGPARMSGRDGVFLIGGVRGSGKSRLLRILKDRYRDAFEGREGGATAPIWISVDLGQQFDPSQLMRNILSAVMERVRRRHYHDKRRLALTLYVNRVAAWCRNNAAWAIGAIVAMGILLLPALLDGIDLRHSIGKNLHVMLEEWVTTDHPILIFGENWFHVLLLALLACIWILAIAAGTSRRRWSNVVQLILICILCAATYGTVDIATKNAMPALRVVATMLLVGLLGVCLIAALRRPKWCSLLDHVDELSARIRNESTSAPVAVPYVSNLLAQLLPTRQFEPIAEMSLPFLEVQVREFVERAVAVHGRVAFVVDDVDAIPAEHFHAVLRAFRPLAKINGVVVVMAVPEHFYAAYMCVEPNDVHSTVEDFYFLGPPDLYELRPDGAVQPRRELKWNDLHDHLAFVLWNDCWGEPLTSKTLQEWKASSVFEELASLWSPAEEGLHALPQDHVLGEIVRCFGGSYREFLRLTRELLRPRVSNLSEYWQQRRRAHETLESVAMSVFDRASILQPRPAIRQGGPDDDGRHHLPSNRGNGAAHTEMQPASRGKDGDLTADPTARGGNGASEGTSIVTYQSETPPPTQQGS